MLKDNFGRTFPYIRLSITDVCNFKCGYCLPNGYQKDKSDNRTFLTYEEIGRLANKVREGGDINVAKGKVDMLISLHSEGK